MPTIPLVVTVLAALAIAVWIVVQRQRRRSAHEFYRHRLEQALEDGVLSAEEVAELDQIREVRDLSRAEVRMVARAIYGGALKEAGADARLTDDEDESLGRLQAHLGLAEHDLGDANQQELSRLRLLARVEREQLPVVDSPLSLVPHEVCHWVVQAGHASRLARPGGSQPEAQAIGFAVADDRPFSATGARDALRPRADVLPSDLGVFVVTSRRAIFQGARNTISVPHARLDSVALFRDAIRLDPSSGRARGFILVDDPELTAAILIAAARARQREIRQLDGPTVSAGEGVRSRSA